MATVILARALVIFPTEFGDVRARLEYDDALLRITAILVDNPTPNRVGFTVTRDSDNRVIVDNFKVDPGVGQRFPVPTGQANRIDVVVNSRGGLDGYSFGAAYPA